MKNFLVLTLTLLTLFSASAQIPSGYYSTATGTGAALKTQLYNIIKGHTALSYSALWTAYQYTDRKADGTLWDMYSNCSFTYATDQCGGYTNECDCYNREHSWPKSWFNDATPMYTDLFHIVPTDGKVNGMRSNYPFGTVSSPTYTSGNGSKLGPCSFPGYTGIVFEPVDEYKGDFARNYFYMATRYENIISSWHSNDVNAEAILQPNSFPVFEEWFVNLLITWHNADPVSQKEIDRNNVIYTNYQHNRNPFIDHPEYVAAIWGLGTVLPEPTNHVLGFTAGTVTSTSIPLTWSNNDGTQAADKFLILVNTTGAFTTPVDGTPVNDDIDLSDNTGAINVVHSAQAYSFTALSPATTYYFKIYPYTNSAANINYKTSATVPSVTISTLNNPQLTATPVSLNGFSNFISAPSASQTFSLSGVALTPAAGSIIVTGTAAFEVSADNITFGSTATFTYTSNVLTPKTVYVRLKAGLIAGTYSAQLVAASGGGAVTVNVSCSGTATLVLPEPTNYSSDFSSHSILLEWDDATGAIQPTGYLIRRSITGFSSIGIPLDGSTYSDTGDLYVPFGQEYVWVKNLAPNTLYYFKIFAYTGSGNAIDYKTDGTVPQIFQTTTP